MSAHLGHAVMAFVDGELDHQRRDEVLGHLTHCAECRAEVEGLRRLKAAMRGGDASVPCDLTFRLLASNRPAASVAARRLPHLRRRPSRHARLRRTAVTGALVALGLGSALSLAGPPPRGPVAPVDPTNVGFLIDHQATSTEVPFTELDVVSVSSKSSPSP